MSLCKRARTNSKINKTICYNFQQIIEKRYKIPNTLPWSAISIVIVWMFAHRWQVLTKISVASMIFVVFDCFVYRLTTDWLPCKMESHPKIKSTTKISLLNTGSVYFTKIYIPKCPHRIKQTIVKLVMHNKKHPLIILLPLNNLQKQFWKNIRKKLYKTILKCHRIAIASHHKTNETIFFILYVICFYLYEENMVFHVLK